MASKANPVIRVSFLDQASDPQVLEVPTYADTVPFMMAADLGTINSVEVRTIFGDGPSDFIIIYNQP